MIPEIITSHWPGFSANCSTPSSPIDPGANPDPNTAPMT